MGKPQDRWPTIRKLASHEPYVAQELYHLIDQGSWAKGIGYDQEAT